LTQAAGGTVEAVTGLGLAGVGGGATATGVGAAPGIPTMLAGGALAANGLDNAQAGLRTAITGEAHHTLLADGAGASARALGASNGTAETVATGVDIAQGIVAGVGTRAAGKAIATAKEAAAAQAVAAVTREKSAASVLDKLDRYLLNPDHPKGASKAEWFKQALGFDRTNMGDLAKQFVFDRAQAVQTDVTQYGTKFNQTIDVIGANGRTIPVNTAWIVGSDSVPKLVIAVPGK
jgi:hypothetical protein